LATIPSRERRLAGTGRKDTIEVAFEDVVELAEGKWEARVKSRLHCDGGYGVLVTLLYARSNAAW
jgi:hypothetical protein